MTTIYHISTRDAWERASAGGAYRTESLPAEGFIHCSTRDQLIKVANLRFRGQQGLVLLAINAEKVTPRIVYENLEGGEELYPHIYGEIDLEAVEQVASFTPNTDGYFAFPKGLA
jgi:uncharacterized protein (DUF952 family)